MSREIHVRFCEGAGGQFPRATRLTIGFELEEDARRVHAVLPKRFGKYGLTLHPEKTRLLRFGSRSQQNGPCGPSGGGESFDFLGFTHHWGKTKKGTIAVQRRTMRSRFSRALRAVSIWCRTHRHLTVAEQAQHLARKLLGHYAYYGITGNMRPSPPSSTESSASGSSGYGDDRRRAG